MIAAGSIAKGRLLIVDDRREIRDALRDLFEDVGLDVVGEAEDGAEAIGLARTTHPHIVVTDLRMPGMGGIELSHTIRQELPSAAIIILTAYDDPALREQASRGTISAYLTKGSPPADIIEAVLGAWERHPAHPGPGAARVS